MHKKNIIKAGQPLDLADKAVIMLHGRGATAEDILSLSFYLNLKNYSLLAPQATNNSWYPYSFLAPVAQNEPWLSSALMMIKGLVADINEKGINSENIYFVGFSQGACLTLEYIGQNAQRYGGVAAFTGGLIGDIIYPDHYKGNFNRTPIFIGTGNPDPHVPVERVNTSSEILKNMNADVTTVIYKNMGHTISEDEINNANKLIFNT